jgi:eukaryotic-like serine/threonine-protein kinase
LHIRDPQTTLKKSIVILFLLVAREPIYSTLSSVAESPGAMFRANLERTGVYQTQGMPRLHGVKWKFKTERVIEAWFSSPTVSSETVYCGSDDGYLYALNALTGELKWKLKTGDVVYSSPAVADGVVYVGSHDGYLYAVDEKTGAERWRFKTEDRVYSSPAVSNGYVYFGSADNYFYAIESATGKLIWKFKAGSWIASSPAIANRTLYFGCWDSIRRRSDERTGEMEIQDRISDPFFARRSRREDLFRQHGWDLLCSRCELR